MLRLLWLFLIPRARGWSILQRVIAVFLHECWMCGRPVYMWSRNLHRRAFNLLPHKYVTSTKLFKADNNCWYQIGNVSLAYSSKQLSTNAGLIGPMHTTPMCTVCLCLIMDLSMQYVTYYDWHCLWKIYLKKAKQD